MTYLTRIVIVVPKATPFFSSRLRIGGSLLFERWRTRWLAYKFGTSDREPSFRMVDVFGR